MTICKHWLCNRSIDGPWTGLQLEISVFVHGYRTSADIRCFSVRLKCQMRKVKLLKSLMKFTEITSFLSVCIFLLGKWHHYLLIRKGPPAKCTFETVLPANTTCKYPLLYLKEWFLFKLNFSVFKSGLYILLQFFEYWIQAWFPHLLVQNEVFKMGPIKIIKKLAESIPCADNTWCPLCTNIWEWYEKI